MMDETPGQGILFASEPKVAVSRPPPVRRANDLDGRKWLRNSVSIWGDLAKSPEEKASRHPAIFPADLAERLLESFTRSNHKVVLDPFCGTGTTVLAAERMGKLGIGLDISDDYIRAAQRRPALNASLFAETGRPGGGDRRFIAADARDLLQHVAPDSVDFVLTSPPYWDILLRHRSVDLKEPRNYGDSSLDLGRISDYQAFLDALGAVFAGVHAVLKSGRYCCVVIMDLRKGGRFYPLHADLAVQMQNIGFVFDDIIIWDRSSEYNNLRPLGHPAVFRINKVHEYILIFQKPE